MIRKELARQLNSLLLDERRHHGITISEDSLYVDDIIKVFQHLMPCCEYNKGNIIKPLQPGEPVDVCDDCMKLIDEEMEAIHKSRLPDPNPPFLEEKEWGGDSR